MLSTEPVTEPESLDARADLARSSSLPDSQVGGADLLESAPVAIYRADSAGRLVYANPAYRHLFGLQPNQSLGDWACAVHPADRAALEESRSTLLRQAERRSTEFRVCNVEGGIRFCRERTVRVASGAGLVGSIEDISDLIAAREARSAADAALEGNRSLLEAVVAGVPIALLACDSNGRLTIYNSAAAELLFDGPAELGSASDVLHEHPRTASVFLPDGRTRVGPADRPLARAMRGETVSNLELLVVRREGAPRSTLGSARRLVGRSGECLGAVTIVQDVTEHRQRELELEQIHRQLIEASREAGMAEVATSVLHNVGNVLNSVNVSAALLRGRLGRRRGAGLARVAALLKEQEARLGSFFTADERGKRLPDYLAQLAAQLLRDQEAELAELAELVQSIEHIKDIVRMQQNYAKIGSITETVEVKDLVEDSVRMAGMASSGPGFSLQRDIELVPPVTVDKHKLLQILVNLLRNAKQACQDSPGEEKHVSIRIKPSPLGVSISVGDNGVGIATENITRIFCHGFTTRKTGHGFGLHMSALAARELGGSLRAASAGIGCGATFTVDIPLASPKGA